MRGGGIRKCSVADLENSNRDTRSRIGELEQELESVRELVCDLANSASSHDARFDLVSRASSDGIWEMEIVAGDPTNPKNRFWGSEQFMRLLGFKDQKAYPSVKATWIDLLCPKDKQSLLDALALHLNDQFGQTAFNVKSRLAMKDDSYRWFYIQGDTLHDEKGRPVRMAGFLRDIHDELEHQRERDIIITRFELAREMLSDGLWDMEVIAGDPVNPENRIWWSPQFRRLLGFETVEEFPDVLHSWVTSRCGVRWLDVTCE
jgi:PAS domain-containing protein